MLLLFGASSVPQASASVIPTSPPAPSPARHASSVTLPPADTSAQSSIPWRRQAADSRSDGAGSGSGSSGTSATGGTGTASITSASDTVPSSGPSSDGSTASSVPSSTVDSATSQTTTAPPSSGSSDATTTTTTRGSPSPQSATDSGASSVCPPSLFPSPRAVRSSRVLSFAFTGDDDWAIHLGEPAAEPVSAHVVLTANLAFAPHNVLPIVILALVLAFIAVHARVHVLVGFANGPAHRPDIAIFYQQWTYHERFRHFDFDRDRTNKLANVWLKHKLAW
ncbi:hypothetical protein ACG7TL_001604 [Trametes sanguinea]